MPDAYDYKNCETWGTSYFACFLETEDISCESSVTVTR